MMLRSMGLGHCSSRRAALYQRTVVSSLPTAFPAPSPLVALFLSAGVFVAATDDLRRRRGVGDCCCCKQTPGKKRRSPSTFYSERLPQSDVCILGRAEVALHHILVLFFFCFSEVSLSLFLLRFICFPVWRRLYTCTHRALLLLCSSVFSLAVGLDTWGTPLFRRSSECPHSLSLSVADEVL